MKKTLLLIFTGLFSTTIGFCQISIPANSLVKENFNAIGSTATATLPASWKMSSAGTGLASGYATGTNVTATTQAASSGTPTTGGRYNWATTPGTDRAIGFMSDAGYADGNAIFADYKNTTGATVSSVNIRFNIERYRINTGSASVAFFSSTDGIAWTARAAGDISAAVFTPGPSSYTFTSPQTVYKNLTISGLSIANNADIYFRWVFTTGGAASQGLGLDDVVLFAPPTTPVITGSMRDNLQVDNNADNQAGAGDQLRYTTVVRNKGTGDATNVTFTNLTPANTTLNAGSVKTSALARDDSYVTAINTTIPQTAASVLGNDFGMPSPTVISFGPVSDPTTTANGVNTAKSDNGGTVTMFADGTFSYVPPTGFTGFDLFSYVATTGTAPDNGAVVIILVGSSVITTGAAESYNVTGNVSITTPNSGVGNLLNNDTGNGIAIGSVNGSASSVGNPFTTANGGTLTVNSNGSFTYNPAPGYEGPDNFTYTVDNGFSNPSAPVTVTLTVAGMIWFIDNNYSGTLTDGRLGSPFKTIAAFQGINDGIGLHPAVNDNIFIYESGTDYNGNISLLNGQKLIGQDATGTLSAISTITFPLYTNPALPVTNSANGTIVRLITTAASTNAITLLAGASNTVRGLTIGNTTGAKLFSAGFGTLTIGDNTFPDVTLNGSGQAMNLSAGTFGATSGFVSVTSTSSGTQGINLSGIAGTVDFNTTNISGSITQGILIATTTATIDFGNTVVSAGTDGISFQNNSGANTKTFGTLSITTTGGFSSFLHSNGGGIVTAGVTTISNGTGNGIDILNNTTAVTFGATTVTKSGAGNAINIANTGSSNGNITFGGVTLGTAGTRLTGPAINIVNTGGTNTSVYDFGAVSIFTNAATGIIATNVDGTINTSSGTVDVTGAAALNISGPAGLTTLGMTLATVNSNGGTNNVNFTSCAGNATLNGGSLTGTAAGTTFNITGGTLGLTYSGIITQAANAAMVGINGGHSGTITFQTGALNATLGTGLQFDNADGNYNFNGVATLNGGDAGIDIINGSAGNFTFLNAPITNPSGVAFNVNGGGGVIAHTGIISKTSGGRLIDIQSRTGGSVTINSNLSSGTSCTGINVSSCSGGTVTFAGTTKTMNTPGITPVTLASNGGATINFTNGGLAITSTTVTGFNATGGGTVSVSGTGNTISSTTGTALNVVSTNIGAANLNFVSISSTTSSTNTGIILNGTGSAGGLVVAGGAGAGSGGTIANKTGADGATVNGCGIYLNSTSGVSLTRMQINDCQNYGIYGSSVTGFSLANSVINGTNGTNNAGGTEEGSLRFDGLFTSVSFPTAAISNCTISGGYTQNVWVKNTSGTLNRLSMTNNTFGLIGTIAGNDNVDITAQLSATLNVTCNDNFFLGTRADFFECIADNNAVMDIVCRQNKFTDGQAIIPGGGTGVSIRGDGVGTAVNMTFDVSCNRISGGTANSYDVVGMFFAKGKGNGTFSGTINNNIIGPAKAASNADGLFIRAAGTNTITTLISNNAISGFTSSAIHLQNNDGNCTMNASIFGNTVSAPGGFAFSGLFLDNGATATDANQMNVVVGNATVPAQKNDFSAGDPSNFSDISINNNFAGTTLRLSKNGSAAATSTQVLKDDNNNPATTAVTPAGTITLVATLPTLPAAVNTSCAIPAFNAVPHAE